MISTYPVEMIKRLEDRIMNLERENEALKKVVAKWGMTYDVN